jgi:hypothetical protein
VRSRRSSPSIFSTPGSTSNKSKNDRLSSTTVLSLEAICRFSSLAATAGARIDPLSGSALSFENGTKRGLGRYTKCILEMISSSRSRRPGNTASRRSARKTATVRSEAANRRMRRTVKRFWSLKEMSAVATVSERWLQTPGSRTNPSRERPCTLGYPGPSLSSASGCSVACQLHRGTLKTLQRPNLRRLVRRGTC